MKQLMSNFVIIFSYYILISEMNFLMLKETSYDSNIKNNIGFGKSVTKLIIRAAISNAIEEM